MVNKQAHEAGSKADEIIKNLANPSPAIETDKATVQVLDKARPVEQRIEEEQASSQSQSPPVAAKQPEEDAAFWKNRFTGFKTSADKTIHSLRQKANQFDLVEQENSQLKEQLNSFQEQAPAPTEDLLKHFSEEETDSVSTFVDTKVSAMERQVAQLSEQVAAYEQAEREAMAAKSHNDIINAVRRAVPDYDSIDSDPAFEAWIKDVDDFGNLRMPLLVAAKNSNPPDIARLVKFYVDFAEVRKSQEQEAPQYTQQELLQTPASIPKPKVEPTGSRKVWDAAAVSQLYKDKAIGKISNEEFKRQELDLYSR